MDKDMWFQMDGKSGAESLRARIIGRRGQLVSGHRESYFARFYFD